MKILHRCRQIVAFMSDFVLNPISFSVRLLLTTSKLLIDVTYFSFQRLFTLQKFYYFRFLKQIMAVNSDNNRHACYVYQSAHDLAITVQLL